MGQNKFNYLKDFKIIVAEQNQWEAEKREKAEKT
jgi:hypothetical protein